MYIDHRFFFSFAAPLKYCSAALSEGKNLNIGSYHSCLWLHVFEVNWIDSYLLLTFISLTCVWTLCGHNEEKVIRPLPSLRILTEIKFAAGGGIIEWFFFLLLLFIIIYLFFAFFFSSLFICGLTWLRCC